MRSLFQLKFLRYSFCLVFILFSCSGNDFQNGTLLIEENSSVPEHWKISKGNLKQHNIKQLENGLEISFQNGIELELEQSFKASKGSEFFLMDRFSIQIENGVLYIVANLNKAEHKNSSNTCDRVILSFNDEIQQTSTVRFSIKSHASASLAKRLLRNPSIPGIL